MNTLDTEDNINELLNSSEMYQIPNIIQELFHKMNSKIDSLTNKINLLQHNCADVATKEHLNTISATKVDINDFLNTVNNIDQHIKQKPSIEEIKYLSEEKISKSDLNLILSDYVHKQDLENILDNNIKTNNFINNKNIENRANYNEIMIEINKKINALPSMKDLDKINSALLKNAEKINEINNLIKNKVDMNYLDNQLKKKLDIYIFDKIQNDLNLKSNLEEFDKLKEDLDKKIDAQSYNNIIRVLNNKLDKKEINNIIDELIEKINEILDIDFDRFIESVKTQFNNVNNAVNKLSKEKIDKIFFEERLNTKLDSRKLLNELEKHNQENKLKLNDFNLKNKENMENISLKIEDVQLNFNNEISSLKDDIKNIIKELNSLTNNTQYNFDLVIKEKNDFDFFQKEITNKLNNLFEKIEVKLDKNIFNKNLIKIQEDLKNHMNNITQDKITYNEVENIIKNLNEKNGENLTINKNNFDTQLSTINDKIISLEKNKITYEQLNATIEAKMNEVNIEINKRAFNTDVNNINNKNKIMNQIQSELINTYNKNEENNLLNEKISTETFNSVIKELNNLIDTKLDIIDYQKYIDIQEIINNIFLTENARGVWKWVSSKLKNNYIPLEIEYYNTMRDNFLWEEDRTSLMILNKGVYNIKIVIFSNESDANVTLVINGENLVSKNKGQNSQDKNREIAENNKYDFNKIEIDEIICINDKVRISILFSGKNINAKGYMKISSVYYEQEKDIEIKNTKAVEERLSNNILQDNIYPSLLQNNNNNIDNA